LETKDKEGERGLKLERRKGDNEKGSEIVPWATPCALSQLAKGIYK